MAGTQTIKVVLQRDSLQTPWGFRLQGGADFRTPFTINKITAGSPADGALHRGDVILEINDRSTNSMLHTEALELVQRAGGQVTFLIQRGPNSSSLPSFTHSRPLSAMPWSLANATSYLERSSHPPWSPTANVLSPTSFYRSRGLERIPDPKPLLSQTGSPIMPGPVPSVSTKTRGYIQPPAFHTEPSQLYNASTAHAGFSPDHFSFPIPYSNTQQQRNASQQPSYNSSMNQAARKYPTSNEADIYVPSYQKKVPVNVSMPKQNLSHQRDQQHYISVMRQNPSPQQQRPASTQPAGLVHRQFNSPMALYSNDNIQDVMKNHISHISRVSHPNQSSGAYFTEY